jgi:hypothetical protein
MPCATHLPPKRRAAEECNWKHRLPKIAANGGTVFTRAPCRRPGARAERGSPGSMNTGPSSYCIVRCSWVPGSPRRGAPERQQGNDFLLRNYNKRKNSDTLSDGRFGGDQQNGFQQPRATMCTRRSSGPHGRLIYLSNCIWLPLTFRQPAARRRHRRELFHRHQPTLCRNKDQISAKICGWPDSSNRE